MKMTRISVALAMLGLSAVAFAGMPGNQVVAPSGVNLIAPDSVGVWSVGLEAMYVQQTNNAFNYGQTNAPFTSFLTRTQAIIPTSDPNMPRSNKNVGDNWEWGGTVDLTYLFPGSSRDVKLAWTHLFDNTDSSHTTIGNGQSFTPSFYHPLSLFAGEIINDGSAYGSTETNYDAVDLVFGQWIKIGDRVDLHPFGGLRWAEVHTVDKGNYFQNDTVSQAGFMDAVAPTLSSDSYNKLDSNFNGIGPRAGFDTAVHLGAGFSIVGTFAGSLLVGDLNSNIKSTSHQYNPVTGALVTTLSDEVDGDDNGTSIVPELDARLGLDYMYAFTPTTSMNIQLGYQVVNYFDVTEADFQGDAGSSFGLIPNTTSDRTNWGYQGPYLRLQLNIV